MRFRLRVCGIVAVGLAITACGGDDESAGSGTASPTSEAVTETTSANTAGASGASTAPGSAPASEEPASGDPVKVLVILDESAAANNFLDTARSGATARVERINAEGGLGGSGRPVELDFCVTDLDPNKTLACANNAANDDSYVAVAASFTSAAETAPIFEEAGLAHIPGAAFIPGDWSSPNVFGINSGAFVVAGVGTIACNVLGYTSLIEGRSNLPASVAATDLLNAALESNGCDPVTESIDIPIDSPDVSTQVASLGDSDAEAVTLDILPHMAEQIFPARQQLGIDKPFVGAVGEFTNESVQNLGEAVEGVHVAGWHPTDDFESPGNTAYLDDFEASGADEGLKGDTSRGAYVAVDLLDFAARNAASIDRKGILDALNQVTDYDAGGLTPVLDFTKPAPNPTFPRSFNMTVFHAVIEDGAFSAAGDDFVPIFGTNS